MDNKAVGVKDADVLKRTFARVFYDHLGFYGEDLKLARLERFVDDKGLTKEFRTAFEQINGEPWSTPAPSTTSSPTTLIAPSSRPAS